MRKGPEGRVRTAAASLAVVKHRFMIRLPSVVDLLPTFGPREEDTPGKAHLFPEQSPTQPMRRRHRLSSQLAPCQQGFPIRLFEPL